LNLRTRDDLRQFARATANQPSARLSKIAQNGRQSGFVHRPLRDGDHRVVEALIGIADWSSIQDEKDRGRVQARTLVAVDEWLVLRDVKSIGRQVD
jgi:hypothetical protein